MLFNSHEFIFIFLPIALVLYFALSRFTNERLSKTWLVIASLAFYSYWDLGYLPVILFSLGFNYLMGNFLSGTQRSQRFRLLALVFGITTNVALLGYFKYTDFVITSLNQALDSDLHLLNLALPLAISFFTFQQIAFLVDGYQRKTEETDPLNYCLFVTFFPQLIAGPIVHHKEMIPQFASENNKRFNFQNASKGIFIFFNGLFKKVIIADTLAVYATMGFDEASVLGFQDAWLTSLSYSFQLYYDFSGYTDMAIGLGLLFNIKLPFNFNSPYLALDIQDFWRRWHITLSRFLRDYIYIPLGGNRLGKFNTYKNLFLTFLIGGIWHGAGWTFIFWGALHGLAMVVFRMWKRGGNSMNRFLAWFVTFQFVNIAWIFFRATSWSDALKVLKGMAGMTSSVGGSPVSLWSIELGLTLTASLLGVLLVKNTNHIQEKFQPNWMYLSGGVAIALIAVLSMFKISEFIYFGF